MEKDQISSSSDKFLFVYKFCLLINVFFFKYLVNIDLIRPKSFRVAASRKRKRPRVHWVNCM